MIGTRVAATVGEMLTRAERRAPSTRVLAKSVKTTLKQVFSRSYRRLCRAQVLFSARRERAGSVTPRQFRIVTALDYHGGIQSGALLQFNAWARHAGASVQLLNASASWRNPLFRLPQGEATGAGTAYVYHCGAPETGIAISATLPQAAGARRIGYWAWELPDPPADWKLYGDLVHEIWVPSTFSRDSLRRMFPDHPIHVVPHVPAATHRSTPVPGRPFTVLTMVDGRSSVTRKNPMGALEAFRRAFADMPGEARLIVKTGYLKPAAAEALRAAVAKVPGASLVEQFLDDAALDRLFRSADVLLSLHRAEGFGLPMAEAMARGIAVVATAWSGNMEFCTDQNCMLVPFRLVPVQDEAGIYGLSSWADPDLDVAARFLRQLADDRALLARMSDAAYASARGWSWSPPW